MAFLNTPNWLLLKQTIFIDENNNTSKSKKYKTLKLGKSFAVADINKPFPITKFHYYLALYARETVLPLTGPES